MGEPVAYVVQENVRKSDQLECSCQPPPLYNTFIHTEGVETYGSFTLSSAIHHIATCTIIIVCVCTSVGSRYVTLWPLNS